MKENFIAKIELLLDDEDNENLNLSMNTDNIKSNKMKLLVSTFVDILKSDLEYRFNQASVIAELQLKLLQCSCDDVEDEEY